MTPKQPKKLSTKLIFSSRTEDDHARYVIEITDTKLEIQKRPDTPWTEVIEALNEYVNPRNNQLHNGRE